MRHHSLRKDLFYFISEAQKKSTNDIFACIGKNWPALTLSFQFRNFFWKFKLNKDQKISHLIILILMPLRALCRYYPFPVSPSLPFDICKQTCHPKNSLTDLECESFHYVYLLHFISPLRSMITEQCHFPLYANVAAWLVLTNLNEVFPHAKFILIFCFICFV